MDASLEEWGRYMLEGDEVTNIRFTNEVKVLGDRDRSEALNKTDGPLVEAARRDVHKIIEKSKADLASALAECQFPGCSQVSEGASKLIKRFEDALIKGSWTGMSGFKSERRISLSDLLSMKAAGRRETEAAIASLAAIAQEEAQKRQALGLAPVEFSASAGPSGGSSKMLIIAIVVIGLLLVFALAGWILFVKTVPERMTTPLDASFKRQLQTQILNL